MDISATEAARRFSEILDAVEHRGESFVIVGADHEEMLQSMPKRPFLELGPTYEV